MTSRESIEMSVQYKADDFISASRHYRQTIGLSKLNKLFAFIFLTAGVGFFLFWGPKWYVILLFAATLEAWFDFIGEIRSRINYVSNESSMTCKLYRFVIDETEISISDPVSETKRGWDRYKGFMESKKAFLLLVDKGLYTIYPKRAFRDEDQQNYFRELAQEKIRLDHGKPP